MPDFEQIATDLRRALVKARTNLLAATGDDSIKPHDESELFDQIDTVLGETHGIIAD